MIIMVTQKNCRTLLVYLFTCMLVVFVAGCGGGGAGEDQAVIASPTTPTTTPFEENYIEIAAIAGPIVPLEWVKWLCWMTANRLPIHRNL